MVRCYTRSQHRVDSGSKAWNGEEVANVYSYFSSFLADFSQRFSLRLMSLKCHSDFSSVQVHLRMDHLVPFLLGWTTAFLAYAEIVQLFALQFGSRDIFAVPNPSLYFQTNASGAALRIYQLA